MQVAWLKFQTNVAAFVYHGGTHKRSLQQKTTKFLNSLSLLPQLYFLGKGKTIDKATITYYGHQTIEIVFENGKECLNLDGVFDSPPLLVNNQSNIAI